MSLSPLCDGVMAPESHMGDGEIESEGEELRRVEEERDDSICLKRFSRNSTNFCWDSWVARASSRLAVDGAPGKGRDGGGETAMLSLVHRFCGTALIGC